MAMDNSTGDYCNEWMFMENGKCNLNWKTLRHDWSARMSSIDSIRFFSSVSETMKGSFFGSLICREERSTLDIGSIHLTWTAIISCWICRCYILQRDQHQLYLAINGQIERERESWEEFGIFYHLTCTYRRVKRERERNCVNQLTIEVSSSVCGLYLHHNTILMYVM